METTRIAPAVRASTGVVTLRRGTPLFHATLRRFDVAVPGPWMWLSQDPRYPSFVMLHPSRLLDDAPEVARVIEYALTRDVSVRIAPMHADITTAQALQQTHGKFEWVDKTPSELAEIAGDHDGVGNTTHDGSDEFRLADGGVLQYVRTFEFDLQWLQSVARSIYPKLVPRQFAYSVVVPGEAAIVAGDDMTYTTSRANPTRELCYALMRRFDGDREAMRSVLWFMYLGNASPATDCRITFYLAARPGYVDSDGLAGCGILGIDRPDYRHQK
jgi:hypothetical protein